VLGALLALFVSAEALGQATIVIQNGDAPGVGFNDTTPAAPAGGNNGTTVGEQRLIAFQAAASIWGRRAEQRSDHYDSRNLGGVTVYRRWYGNALAIKTCGACAGTIFGGYLYPGISS
jgi:hypothetical protein